MLSWPQSQSAASLREASPQYKLTKDQVDPSALTGQPLVYGDDAHRSLLGLTLSYQVFPPTLIEFPTTRIIRPSRSCSTSIFGQHFHAEHVRGSHGPTKHLLVFPIALEGLFCAAIMLVGA